MSSRYAAKKHGDELGPFGVSQAVIFGEEEHTEEEYHGSRGVGEQVDALMTGPTAMIAARGNQAEQLLAIARRKGYIRFTLEDRGMGYDPREVARLPIFREIETREGFIARATDGTTFFVKKISNGSAGVAPILEAEGNNYSGALAALNERFSNLNEEGEFEMEDPEDMEFDESGACCDEPEESGACCEEDEDVALPEYSAALDTAHNVVDVVDGVAEDMVEAFDASGALLVKRAEVARELGMTVDQLGEYEASLSPEDLEAFQKSYAFFGLTNKIGGKISALRRKSTEANTKAKLKSNLEKQKLKQAKLKQKMLLEAQKKRFEAEARAYQKAAERELAKQAKKAEKEGEVAGRRAVAAMEAQRRQEQLEAEKEEAQLEREREASKRELEEGRGEVADTARETAAQRAERQSLKEARKAAAGGGGDRTSDEEAGAEEESFGAVPDTMYTGPMRTAVVQWSAVRNSDGSSPMVTPDTADFYKELNPRAGAALQADARAEALDFMEAAGFSGGTYIEKAKSVHRINGQVPEFCIIETATTPAASGAVVAAEDWGEEIDEEGNSVLTEETLLAPGDKASMATWTGTVTKDGVVKLRDPYTRLRPRESAAATTRVDYGRVMIVPEGGSKAHAQVWRLESSPSFPISKGHARYVTLENEKLPEDDPYRFGRGVLYGAEHSNADGSIVVDTRHLFAAFGDFPTQEEIEQHTVDAGPFDEE